MFRKYQKVMNDMKSNEYPQESSNSKHAERNDASSSDKTSTQNDAIVISSDENSDDVQIISPSVPVRKAFRRSPMSKFAEKKEEEPSDLSHSYACTRRPVKEPRELHQNRNMNRDISANRGLNLNRGLNMNPPMEDFDPNAEWVVEMLTPISDVCIHARSIPAYKVPDSIMRGESFCIYLTQIHHPYKFWFNIHMPDKRIEIEDFENELHRFYVEEAKKDFNIHPNLLTVGRACAALYMDVWHRGEIISPYVSGGEENCKIFFTDYGTVAYVPNKNLRFLKKSFGALPRQAMRGRLAFVKPPNCECLWRLEAYNDATYAMNLLGGTKLLQAIPYAYEDEEQIFHLIIRDENQQLMINEELANRGFAEYLTESNDIFPHREETFPTFTMLEKGEYPEYGSLALGNNHVSMYAEYIDAHPGVSTQPKSRRILQPRLFFSDTATAKTFTAYDNEQIGSSADTINSFRQVSSAEEINSRPSWLSCDEISAAQKKQPWTSCHDEMFRTHQQMVKNAKANDIAASSRAAIQVKAEVHAEPAEKDAKAANHGVSRTSEIVKKLTFLRKNLIQHSDNEKPDGAAGEKAGTAQSLKLPVSPKRKQPGRKMSVVVEALRKLNRQAKD